jgi:hypothetical protein
VSARGSVQKWVLLAFLIWKKEWYSIFSSFRKKKKIRSIPSVLLTKVFIFNHYVNLLPREIEFEGYTLFTFSSIVIFAQINQHHCGLWWPQLYQVMLLAVPTACWTLAHQYLDPCIKFQSVNHSWNDCMINITCISTLKIRLCKRIVEQKIIYLKHMFSKQWFKKKNQDFKTCPVSSGRT